MSCNLEKKRLIIIWFKAFVDIFSNLHFSWNEVILVIKRILFSAAPRFRNSIAGPVTDFYRTSKRPHSVISMSSISSSSTSSGGSTGCGLTTPTSVTLSNLGFDSVCGSPKPCRRSGTLNSQCSTGIFCIFCADETAQAKIRSLFCRKWYYCWHLARCRRLQR